MKYPFAFFVVVLLYSLSLSVFFFFKEDEEEGSSFNSMNVCLSVQEAQNVHFRFETITIFLRVIHLDYDSMAHASASASKESGVVGVCLSSVLCTYVLFSSRSRVCTLCRQPVSHTLHNKFKLFT